VPHSDCGEVHGLGGNIATVTVGMLAEQAIARVGDDAEVVLGRRSIPLGMYCPACRAVWGSPLLLMPAAQRAPRPCTCAVPPRPLGERNTVGARELLGLHGGTRSLRDFGAGAGDEFLVSGSKGTVGLRCDFAWGEIG
jgi:hypothetical protein